jgi:uncharacterized protein (DUF58 family)
LAPIGISLAVLAAWWLVAHNSGSGWVQAVGDFVFGALLVGTIGPAFVLARATLHVTAAPADGTAGLPLQVEVCSTTRLRVRPVTPAGPESFVGPARTKDGSGITLIPERRGVHETLTMDIGSAAPFGLQWWTKRIVVPLPEPLHVSPRRGAPEALPPRSNDDQGQSPRHVPSTIGEPRGVRPYRPGDVRRHVHWPATAHAGELMARELEEPSAEPTIVTVRLPLDTDQAEHITERALGTILALQARGSQVLLDTNEPTGLLVGLVPDRRSAGRRLARAVAGLAGEGISVQR